MIRTKHIKLSKILRCIFFGIAVLILVFLLVRFIGVQINKRVPVDGVNEEFYVEINGVKQWISIYGEDKRNPVLLYLHGGPGSSTSAIDYVITRKWADVYTVVTWDQRNCGKSYDKSQNGIKLTKDLLMTDGKELTEFIRNYLSVEKITLLGHSWGSIYGANLVLENPDYYECFIGTGQLVDSVDNERAFKEEASVWATEDEDALALVNQLTPENITMEHITARNKLMENFGYSMMRDGSDYNLITTILFNPNYSFGDWIKYFFTDMTVHLDFFASGEFNDFSLNGKTEYVVPYYNINGDMDYQTNYKLAQEYFDEIQSPKKELYIMENTTHGLLESKSEYFSTILHEIAAKNTP